MCMITIVDLKATSENIIRLREERGLTVKDLQEMFGFATPQSIYKWQQGQAMPTVDNLFTLAAIFKVSVEDIVVVDDVGRREK